MQKKRILIQALVVLVLVWAVILGVRAMAASKRVTAAKIEAEISSNQFEDWSEGIPNGADPSSREAKIRRVADLFNSLDFAERERAHEMQVGRGLYERLSGPEKELFVDLTIRKAMQTFMRAVDAMSTEQRRKIVERGLRQIEEGQTEEEMQAAAEVSEEMLNKITESGMKAYFEEAGTDTKLDLAPLMQAMDDVMKGLRGSQFGPPQ